jgi:Uma2 family endonuclease
VNIETYLHTSFENPDREYRDGKLVRRSLPDYLHSKTQGLVGAFFAQFGRVLPIYPALSVRLKLRESLYLIPDVAVFYPNEPQERVPATPPFVAIEILSPDDRMADLRNKLAEYRAWAVTYMWLVDPHSKRMYTCDAELVEVSVLKITELDLELKPADIFG